MPSHLSILASLPLLLVATHAADGKTYKVAVHTDEGAVDFTYDDGFIPNMLVDVDPEDEVQFWFFGNFTTIGTSLYDEPLVPKGFSSGNITYPANPDIPGTFSQQVWVISPGTDQPIWFYSQPVPENSRPSAFVINPQSAPEGQTLEGYMGNISTGWQSLRSVKTKAQGGHFISAIDASKVPEAMPIISTSSALGSMNSPQGLGSGSLVGGLLGLVLWILT